jgi:hypothetical protein
MWNPQSVTTLWNSTASYGDSFSYLYVDDVRSPQEKHKWASTACYEDSFTFHIHMYISLVEERHWALFYVSRTENHEKHFLHAAWEQQMKESTFSSLECRMTFCAVGSGIPTTRPVLSCRHRVHALHTFTFFALIMGVCLLAMVRT